MEDLLKIYAYHSPKIKYEFIDPGQEPGHDQALRDRPGRHDDLRMRRQGQPHHRPSTEEDVTNALIKVTREKKKTIYFLEGHGENSTEVTDDRRLLLRQGRPGQDGLRGQETDRSPSRRTFPSDCALLVVPGPVKDLLRQRAGDDRDLSPRGRPGVLPGRSPDRARPCRPIWPSSASSWRTTSSSTRSSRLIGGDYFMPDR